MSLSLLEELMLLPWQSLLKCLFFHADRTTGCLYSPTNPVLSVLPTGQEDRRIKKTLATFWSYITECSLNSSTQTLEITLWKPKVDCYSLSVVSLISLTSILLSFPPLQDSWTPPNVWLWIFASASISCWMMTLLWHLDHEPIWSQEIASSGYLCTVPTVPMSLSPQKFTWIRLLLDPKMSQPTAIPYSTLSLCVVHFLIAVVPISTCPQSTHKVSAISPSQGDLGAPHPMNS